MPSRNVIKTYIKDGYYHIYNRGVDKRTIFQDEMDYKVFLNYLKEYLSPPPDPETLKMNITVHGTSFKGIKRQPKNYNKKILLVAYCLMPNHFHLLIQQKEKSIMENFMRSLLTRYSKYFNQKHDRVGTLFQGRYKAVNVSNDKYLLHLSKYIHLNPREIGENIGDTYSSYQDYLGQRQTKWLHPSIILSMFTKSVLPEFAKVNTYRNFVEENSKDSSKILGDIILE